MSIKTYFFLKSELARWRRKKREREIKLLAWKNYDFSTYVSIGSDSYSDSKRLPRSA